ncbi:hypothetical protein [Deinococcus soli (ex Cha et al. 2016)]|uniref:Uncharacterized protein n=2 Tax=Deinococcus soli (ex Cha et al. 2016) TaxID=1309411 RepID=A0AAE4BMQ6_9DEIO|nr:hypothetical protein [Deinococcus soli (ex Cha et al. 2016)]MDR6218737.1 hypothetical protein [Deinococcus soli (ex Cha et al. 2016)]MDR6328534.1 hypothetical protein [Deinococcus soli (ex Cha et al. 2016)]MDR6753145.1 hypothetical protein [Deinococcus soli (ex Cha et al. 2016)]
MPRFRRPKKTGFGHRLSRMPGTCIILDPDVTITAEEFLAQYRAFVRAWHRLGLRIRLHGQRPEEWCVTFREHRPVTVTRERPLDLS